MQPRQCRPPVGLDGVRVDGVGPGVVVGGGLAADHHDGVHIDRDLKNKVMKNPFRLKG